MSKLAFLPFALLALASCGGNSGTDGDYQMLVQQAAAEEAVASSLAPASPCSQASQCGVLTFQHTSGHCVQASYKVYSLLSSTATTAEADAREQVQLANRAVAAAPPPQEACVQSIVLPPSVLCVANTCEASPVQ